MTVVTLMLATLAFALFGIATPAHHARRVGNHLLPRQQRGLRGAAWGAVALSLTTAIMAKGWVFGPILWPGALMPGAAAVFLALNLLPATRRPK